MCPAGGIHASRKNFPLGSELDARQGGLSEVAYEGVVAGQ